MKYNYSFPFSIMLISINFNMSASEVALALKANDSTKALERVTDIKTFEQQGVVRYYGSEMYKNASNIKGMITIGSCMALGGLVSLGKNNAMQLLSTSLSPELQAIYEQTTSDSNILTDATLTNATLIGIGSTAVCYALPICREAILSTQITNYILFNLIPWGTTTVTSIPALTTFFTSVTSFISAVKLYNQRENTNTIINQTRALFEQPNITSFTTLALPGTLLGGLLPIALPTLYEASKRPSSMMSMQACSTYTTEEGDSLLSLALKMNQEHAKTFTEQLLQAVPNPSILANMPVNGIYPLHIAAEKGYSELIATLLTHGAHVRATVPPYGRTALHIAAEKGHANIVEQFMQIEEKEKTFLVNLVDQSGDTPLLLAVLNDKENVVRTLINPPNGLTRADHTISNSKGMTPLMVAHKQGNLQIANILLS